ncbi:hypothetical protein DERP_006272 [Dermatophagoides pteronyssinus]|uniref:Uncharacterized protein n=1 Tax=Dermatophagoides pteronyssinus TaxID=6956 RepID=A0ABQ8IYA9_DERPT|nr:hypothetical protein DERP_006272 [Dermatophagoides pteronyssinus]
MKIIQSLNQSSSSIDMENFLSTSKQIQSLDMIKESKIRNSHSFDFRKMIILIIIMLIITVIYLILIYTIITNEFNDYFADTQQQNYLEKEMKIKKRKEEKRKKRRQKRKEKKRKLKAEKKAKKRKEKLKQKLMEFHFGYQTSTVFKGNTEVLKILEKEIHLPDQRTLSSALGITTKPKPIKKQRPPYWQSPTAALSTSPYKQQQQPPPPPPYWQTPNTALSTSPFEQQQPPQYWQSPTASFLSPPFKPQQQQPQYWQSSPPFKQQYYQEKKQLIKPQKIIINFVPYNSTSTNEISENSDSDQQSQQQHYHHHHHQPQRKSIQNSSNLRISSEHGIATRIGEAVAEAMRINMKVLDDIYPYHKGGDKRNKQ